MPRFERIIFYQNSPKIKLFLKKNAKFSGAGGSAPRPPCLRRLGAPPPDPHTQHPKADFCLRTRQLYTVYNWNDRRSRRVFLCFYSAIFKLTSARFQTFAYNSRNVWSNYMKF